VAITSKDGRLRLLVIASTFPARQGDGTPSFVADLAGYEAKHFSTLALVPRVRGGVPHERWGDLTIERFPYFFRRSERVADGAILENVRADRRLVVQLLPLLVGESIALRRAITRFRPDVVHVHWMVPQGLAALLVARRVPWVLTTLGGDVYALRGPVWRAVKRRVLARSHAVTTMNLDMRERLLALGAPTDRTSVLPMGVNLDRIRAGGVGVDRQPGRLLFVGRLVEKKGASVLIEALRRIPSQIDWSLDIVGDGPLRSGLEASARSLSKPVRFLGQQTREELGSSLHRAEVVVVPSVRAASGDQDGLPVVLLEAMGAGCAIVASRIAGIDEAVEDGVSGVLVPAGDPGSLATALEELLREPSRGLALGAAAARHAERFSRHAIGDQFVAILREAAGRPSGPPSPTQA
jgi:colanic acid/amylovoran biosynthesis glycosyltransferase